MGKILEFKWTVSRAQDSYGYNIVTLYVDGTKVSRCNGGGYDMQGTCLGDWVARHFEKEILGLKTEFYGLTFHDPNFNPGKAVLEDGKTVEEKELKGESLGLDRYQQFYKASNPLPTERHIIPLINGACGFSSVERVLTAIGYHLRWIPTRKRDDSLYELVKEGVDSELLIPESIISALSG